MRTAACCRPPALCCCFLRAQPMSWAACHRVLELRCPDDVDAAISTAMGPGDKQRKAGKGNNEGGCLFHQYMQASHAAPDHAPPAGCPTEPETCGQTNPMLSTLCPTT